MEKNTIQEFWEKVDIRGIDECWPWNGYKDRDGYGRIMIKGKKQLAHRVAFLTRGGILTQEKNCVCHHCDNPSCCNPSHLFAGSIADNTMDMVHKKRNKGAVGENNSHAKLTQKEIKTIRESYIPRKVTYKCLAFAYGVSYNLIAMICRKEIWK